ncbi:MAG: hypothetical protein WCS98_01225 [Bacillota bacterium]|nr:hypothetical protein [Bacillota bacterium]MDD3297587.1 hypothetical protein [Bacillota bacterium]MDD3850973.1 hypothetical protein [Bacillota bacterium]MDD4707292.1 hypothetical protein [Bacillota bacterium]
MNFRKMHGLGNDFVIIDGRVLMEGPATDIFSGRLLREIYPLQS